MLQYTCTLYLSNKFPKCLSSAGVQLDDSAGSDCCVVGLTYARLTVATCVVPRVYQLHWLPWRNLLAHVIVILYTERLGRPYNRNGSRRDIWHRWRRQLYRPKEDDHDRSTAQPAFCQASVDRCRVSCRRSRALVPGLLSLTSTPRHVRPFTHHHRSVHAPPTPISQAPDTRRTARLSQSLLPIAQCKRNCRCGYSAV